jgi:hypothetical protein
MRCRECGGMAAGRRRGQILSFLRRQNFHQLTNVYVGESQMPNPACWPDPQKVAMLLVYPVFEP